MTVIKQKLNLRKTAIILLGLYCVLRGVAFLPVSNVNVPDTINLITRFISLEAWGGVWLAVGIICIIKALSKNEGIAIPLATGLMITWGVGYFIGWINDIITNTPSQAWLSSSAYLLPALVIGIFSAKGGENIELG